MKKRMIKKKIDRIFYDQLPVICFLVFVGVASYISFIRFMWFSKTSSAVKDFYLSVPLLVKLFALIFLSFIAAYYIARNGFSYSKRKKEKLPNSLGLSVFYVIEILKHHDVMIVKGLTYFFLGELYLMFFFSVTSASHATIMLYGGQVISFLAVCFCILRFVSAYGIFKIISSLQTNVIQKPSLSIEFFCAIVFFVLKELYVPLWINLPKGETVLSEKVITDLDRYYMAGMIALNIIIILVLYRAWRKYKRQIISSIINS